MNQNNQLKNKLEIRQWLDKMGIQNYTIEDNLIINVQSHVMIQSKKLDYIPVQFGIVSGNFSCNDNNLISLKGSPHFVGGYFSCNNNKLLSLEYAPEVVGSHFFCVKNNLSTLIGAPKVVKGGFNCADNLLETLEGAPKMVAGDFICVRNSSLNSLTFLPQGIENLLVKFCPLKKFNFLDVNFTQCFNHETSIEHSIEKIEPLKEYYEDGYNEWIEISAQQFNAIKEKFLLEKNIDTNNKVKTLKI